MQDMLHCEERLTFSRTQTFSGIIPDHPSDESHSHLERATHQWGQYSPYFDVPSDIKTDLPDGCEFTFGQVLSRHGSRYPTTFKALLYQALLARLQKDVRGFHGRYAFLEDFSYHPSPEQLTAYGEQELVRSGEAFYSRYRDLAAKYTPFIRTAGQERVVRSAEKFAVGYHDANRGDPDALRPLPRPPISVVISESDHSNNTLSIDTCPAFSSPANAEVGRNAKSTWAAQFVPPIQDRLNADLDGANFSLAETIYMMDLCPYDTVAGPLDLKLSPFCNLFTPSEWKSYDYYYTLEKYYGYSSGNPLAPTLGVGFVNELIARLTQRPVVDETCTNRTLDSSNVTFPLDAKLYADFSHDNDMETIYAALGLYNATGALPLTSVRAAEDAHGFSAAWTVPFAARIYVEKMRCSGEAGEYVRILVNRRVVPLETCGADHLGRCTLEKFISSLSFARGQGHWDQCYVGE